MANIQKKFCILFILFLALIPISAVSMPRGVAFMPGLIGILSLGFYPFVFHEKIHFFRPALIAAITISAFAIASSFWAIDPHDSMKMALRTVGVLLASSLLICTARMFRPENLKPYFWILPVSLFIASILIVIELKCGAPFFRIVRDMPAGSYVNKAEFNRAAVIITLFFFPCMAIFRDYIGTKKTVFLALLTMGPMFIITDSQSSQLALILGFITLAAFPYRYKAAWYILSAGIFILMLSAPFLCIWVFDHMAGEINNAPMMGTGGGYSGARLEIWDYISRYMINSPIYGYGFEATRQVPHFDSHEIYQKGTTILHPHNFVIQIWMEDGLLGILAAGFAITGLLLAMQKYLTVRQARIALPAFIATMLISSTAYGMWQGWWIGTLFTMTAVCMLAIRQQDKTDVK